jgi:L-alanine-DL-glutamate epimerase-like enolase superfamily enzyme
MAITEVDVFQVQWGDQGGQETENRSAWLRIIDDSGHYGLGEASPMLGGLAAATIIRHHLARMLIGADPLDAWSILPRSSDPTARWPRHWRRSTSRCGT